MKLGIVGLPNVGKSTLFNAITNAGAESANYPFCTIDPNVGMVAVPDDPAGQAGRDLPAQEEDPGGHRVCGHRRPGEGRHPRARAWATSSWPTSGRPTPLSMWCAALTTTTSSTWRAACDPARDIEIIDLELVMADLEMVERRIDKATKARQGRTRSFCTRGGGLQGACGSMAQRRANPPAVTPVMKTAREIAPHGRPAHPASR